MKTEHGRGSQDFESEDRGRIAQGWLNIVFPTQPTFAPGDAAALQPL
jgi:hypothetical protein